MSIEGTVSASISRRGSPSVAPELTTSFVREALHRAIHGRRPAARPPRRPPTSSCGSRRGDVDRAIHEVIENHVRYAGAQGFVTNLGGLVTAAVTDPGQHHRAGADPVPDDRRHRPPARLRPRPTRGSATRSWSACSARTSVETAGRKQEAPGAADGAGHRPGPRPATSTGSISARGRLRPDHQGRRQAARDHGGPADPGRRRPGRRGRRRLRHLADRPLRRARAPAPPRRRVAPDPVR